MARQYIAQRLLQEKDFLMSQLQDMMKGMDDVIDLSVGDPDFTTPAPIIEAGYKDALAGCTHYTQHRGYPDVIQAVVDYYKRELGVELKVVDMSFDNLIMSLVNGEFDMVIAGMTSTEEREKIVNFTEAYLKSKILLLMRKGTENMFANYGELMGAKAAAQTGTTHYDNCVQFCGTENVVGLSKVQDMVMELEAGKVDLVFMDYMAVLSYAAKKDDLVAVDLDIPNDYEGYKIATQKDATDFRDYLDEFLVKLNESGQIEKFIVEAQDLAEGE